MKAQKYETYEVRVCHSDGGMKWAQNNKLKGPAVKGKDGNTYFYLQGKFHTKEDFYETIRDMKRKKLQ